jgi:hypothetical protein
MFVNKIRTFIKNKNLLFLVMSKRPGRDIGKAIFNLVKDTSPRPISTRDISLQLKIAWHTADRYCLKLQLKGKLGAFTIGKATAWYLEKNGK